MQENVITPNTPRVFRLPFGGVSIEVEPAATKRLYPCKGCHDWCQCSGCTNFSAAKHRFFPAGIASTLESFGVDPHEPIYLTGVEEHKKTFGWRRYAGYYLVIGRIIDERRSGRIYDVNRARTFIWADNLAPGEVLSDFNYDFDQGAQPYFLLRFSILMPWLPEYIPALDDDESSIDQAAWPRAFRLDWNKSLAVAECSENPE